MPFQIQVGQRSSAPIPIPARCTNPLCGYQFICDDAFGGTLGPNCSINNPGTNCPRCGAFAQMQSLRTDSAGVVSYSNFAGIFKSIDPPILDTIKHSLEAANEDFNGQQLAAILVKADPRFEPATKLIKKLAKALPLAVLILEIISVYYTRSSFELENEQFEYQKKRDAKEDNQSEKIETRIDALERKERELEQRFDSILPSEGNVEVDEKGTKINSQSAPSSKEKFKLKGCDRNKPCECGSGKKAKKCHPLGLPKQYIT